MLVRDFMRIVHRLAPPDLALEWDNSGLQAGSPEAAVTKIGLALDATRGTVEDALAAGCDLLCTHHPLIFKPLKRIDTGSQEGAALSLAARGGLSIFAAHTNWDAAPLGVADALADLLELEERRPLEPLARDFYKLVVFTPKGYEGKLREALFEAGAGRIGDYDRTWFSVPGEGGFRAPQGGRPFVGAPGAEARTPESRLELILPRARAGEAVRAVFQNHPYEEPAFELHPIKIYGRHEGPGLLGLWPHGRDPLAECREKFGPGLFKYCGPKTKTGRVKRVALMPCSGGSYIRLAKNSGAEVLVTGDVGYHQALEAEHLGLMVLDLGHFETEWPGLVRLKDLLTREFRERGETLECLLLTQTGPWHSL
jgi:putative NIF3 family GTP cyclohydrolase 1 type 2